MTSQTRSRLLASGNIRGILFVVAQTVCIAFMHTAIRHMTGQMHPFEITFFRCVFGVLVVVPWLVRYGPAALRTTRFDLQALRAVLNIGSMLAFFFALSIAPLSDATALSFAAPLFATLLGVLFLGERVGVRRWLAMAIGFAGALVIIRPGFGTVGLGQLLCVFSTVSWGVVIIVIKVMGRTETAISITTWMSLLMAPMALVPALFVWTWPTWEQLGWLAFIGISGNVAQLLVVQALKEGETSVVMSFDFLRLLWIAAIAYVVYAEVPGPGTWIGGTIIFAAGAYIAARERNAARGPAPNPD